MSKRKLDSYVGETHESIDPRDEGRRIRIVDVATDTQLRAIGLVPSSVSPNTLVPRGRRSLITPSTLRRAYRQVDG